MRSREYARDYEEVKQAGDARSEHRPGGHSITLTNAKVPEIVLTYSTFRQITDDIDDGRVFGGVHYRFDQDAGARMGERAAKYVLRHALRPVHEPRSRRR